MKLIMAVLVCSMLVGCGTVRGTAGGFFEGASQDLKSVSETIKGQK
jgi:hypothetical protein